LDLRSEGCDCLSPGFSCVPFKANESFQRCSNNLVAEGEVVKSFPEDNILVKPTCDVVVVAYKVWKINSFDAKFVNELIRCVFSVKTKSCLQKILQVCFESFLKNYEVTEKHNVTVREYLQMRC